jgi:hypothetical protein
MRRRGGSTRHNSAEALASYACREAMEIHDESLLSALRLAGLSRNLRGMFRWLCIE